MYEIRININHGWLATIHGNEWILDSEHTNKIRADNRKTDLLYAGHPEAALMIVRK